MCSKEQTEMNRLQKHMQARSTSVSLAGFIAIKKQFIY